MRAALRMRAYLLDYLLTYLVGAAIRLQYCTTLWYNSVCTVFVMVYQTPGVCCAGELLGLCKHQLWSNAFQEAHASQYWTAAGVFPEFQPQQHLEPLQESLLVGKRLQALMMCGTHFAAMVTRLITVLPALTVQEYYCLVQLHCFSSLTYVLTYVAERVWYGQFWLMLLPLSCGLRCSVPTSRCKLHTRLWVCCIADS